MLIVEITAEMRVKIADYYTHIELIQDLIGSYRRAD